MKKHIYCLCGIAASGKSTYANNLTVNNTQALKICADTIREELYGDPTIQGDGSVVFEKVFDQYSKALRDYTTELIIIDNTSLTYKLRKRYYTLADIITPMFQHKFNYHLVFFKPNLERSLKWNKHRSRFVPEDVIRSQFERYMGPTMYERSQGIDIIEIDYGD